MAYTEAPGLAWAGWRLKNPGGPAGGQYHGYIAADETEDYMGWPAGPNEMFRKADSQAGLFAFGSHLNTGQATQGLDRSIQPSLGIYPWHPWNNNWHGVPLLEGETVSDYVYRSPAEVRPRPNASGGAHVIRAAQQMRTAGYAVAPGNYHALGAVPSGVIDMYPQTGVQGGVHKICPAWGCGPPWWGGPVPVTTPITVVSGNSVKQPPPPPQPAPAPTVPIGPIGSSGCAFGQYRDAAGNCTSDWRNPYPMYLPIDTPVAPSPTVPASTCPTGYITDQYGNCVVAGVASTGGSITQWLGSDTSIMGVNVPNFVLLGGVLIVAMRFMKTK